MREFTIQLKLAWWFTYLYVPCLLFFCTLFKMDFNKERFNYWLKKAIIKEWPPCKFILKGAC